LIGPCNVDGDINPTGCCGAFGGEMIIGVVFAFMLVHFGKAFSCDCMILFVCGVNKIGDVHCGDLLCDPGYVVAMFCIGRCNAVGDSIAFSAAALFCALSAFKFIALIP